MSIVTFDDVKRHPNTTYFFLSNTSVKDLDFCLKAAGETDYKFYPYDRFASLPDINSVPEVKLVDLPGCNRLCRKPSVLVSHMDTNQLRTKLQQILRGEDDNLQTKKANDNKTALKNYNENHVWHEGKIPVSNTKV